MAELDQISTAEEGRGPHGFRNDGSTVLDECPKDNRSVSAELNYIQKNKFMPVSCYIFWFLSRANLIPMYWDDPTKTFIDIPSKSFQSIHYNIALYIVLFDFLFVAAKLTQIVVLNWPISTNDVILGEAIALFSIVGTKAMCLAVHYNIVSRRIETINFANQLFKLRFKEKLWNDFAIAKIFIVAISARLAQYIIISVTKPKKNRFWYSILSEEWHIAPIFILHLIFNLQTTFMFFATLFHVATIILYTETMESRLSQPAGQLKSNFDRLLSYRKLQVLAIQFRAAYASFGIPYITLYSFFMSIILAFGSIRYYDTLDLRSYLQMPLSLFMVTAFATAFYSRVGNQPGNSRKALKSRFQTSETKGSNGINCFNQRAESRMYFKSCQLISLFKIKTTFLPLLLRFVVFKTTRLLIVSSQK